MQYVVYRRKIDPRAPSSPVVARIWLTISTRYGREPSGPIDVLSRSAPYASVSRLLDVQQPFEHGASIDVVDRLRLIASFHPSRLNVNTGRITRAMLTTIFREVRDYVDDSPHAHGASVGG